MHEFRTAIEQARATGKVGGLMALLAEDVIFRSPVVYAPYKGRAAVEPLLRAVVRVFDDFSFTRVIGGPGAADHAFVFRAWIGDREVEGCDFLHTGDNGLIDEFYVMVRPISAAMALAQAITNQLVLEQSDEAA